MQTLQKICLVFTIIGALNWGLVGVLDVNIITLLFGVDTAISNLIFAIVGVSGAINIGLLFSDVIDKH